MTHNSNMPSRTYQVEVERGLRAFSDEQISRINLDILDMKSEQFDILGQVFGSPCDEEIGLFVNSALNAAHPLAPHNKLWLQKMGFRAYQPDILTRRWKEAILEHRKSHPKARYKTSILKKLMGRIKQWTGPLR